MTSRPAGKVWLVSLCALCALLYAIRLSGPTDLESYGQALNIAYILDLVTQGHWLLQHDLTNAVISEPPFHTWAMAPFVTVFGLNRLALTLPSFLSVLALCLLVLTTGSGSLKRFGRRKSFGRFDRFDRFDHLAGGLAALAIVFAPPIAQQVALVRSDALFALAVSVAALAAFLGQQGGEQSRKAWLLFWLMAAVATLCKGPIGLLLAAGGLIGCIGMTQSEKPWRAMPLAGVALYLALTLAWLIAAWLRVGDVVVDKMITPGWIEQPGDLLKPPFFLLLRYLPFSVPLVFALWRVFRHPADDTGERRFERFLASWLLCGLLILALFGHQSADDLLPLWPAGALLAGRELAIFARRIGVTRFAGMGLVLGIILLGATYAAVHSPRKTGGAPRSDYGRELQLASDARRAAEAFKALGLDASHLVHIDTPPSLQLYLGTYRPFLDRADLLQVLATADAAVDLVLGDSEIAALHLADAGFATQQRFRWPAEETSPPVFQVYRVERIRE